MNAQKQQLINRLNKLKKASSMLIQNKYFQSSLAAYSQKTTRSVASLSVELYKARSALKYQYGYHDPDFRGFL